MATLRHVGRPEDFCAEAFGQDVIHQRYQCTEGFLARTCERGVLHFAPFVAEIRRMLRRVERA